jgi:predicted CXXCH cytochrome family protein
MTGSFSLRFAALLIVIVAGPVAVALGADLPPAQTGNPFNDVQQTVHNLMPPSSVYTIKELCVACHVDGNIHIPGVPLPPEEAALPVFGAEQEQRPLWNQDTAVKNYALPQNWPLPQPMSTDRPFGTSADCLGCHDGAFAEDVHRGGERYGHEGIGLKAVNDFFDRVDAALGTTSERKSEVPDHPVSTIYPRKPDGELILKDSTSGQRRYYSIPDLEDEELMLPTGPTSKFYAQTPGNLQAPPSAIGNGNGQPVAAPLAGGETTSVATAAEGPEQYRLVHTTYGVIHCDSCHNAHSELHTGFLRDKSPQLCLLCHDR